jgi:uncharacterized membrane protein YedE/YeeE
MAATGSSLVSVALLEHFGDVHHARHPAKKLALGFGVMGGYGANIVGGVILGVGVALSGACPGTAMAQFGTGVWSAKYTLGGALLGAAGFALTQHTIKKKAESFQERGDAVFFDKVLGLPMWKAAMLIGSAVFAGVYAMESVIPWAADTQPLLKSPIVDPSSVLPVAESHTWSPLVGGALLGLLQVPSVLMLRHNLAASGSFVSVAGMIYATLTGDREFERLPYFKNFYGAGDFGQLGTVLGIVAGAYASARLSGVEYVADTTGSALTHVVGGFLMMFGARVAGGCASGHGISGLGRLSSGSTATVAGMFAGGMLGVLFL